MGDASTDAGSPDRRGHDPDEEVDEFIFNHGCYQRDKHWQGSRDDADWQSTKLRHKAFLRRSFGTVTRYREFCHLAAYETSFCPDCGKESSGNRHAKGCEICDWRQPQLKGWEGEAIVVKCGTCRKTAAGCKNRLRMCACGKTAEELLLGTLCRHVRPDVSVGCKHARTGLCNVGNCKFCHCASPPVLVKKPSRHGARFSSWEMTIDWSHYWRNVLKVQMFGHLREDYELYNKNYSIVDPFNPPQDKSSFPLRFVLSSKAQQQFSTAAATFLEQSVGVVFQCKRSW